MYISTWKTYRKSRMKRNRFRFALPQLLYISTVLILGAHFFLSATAAFAEITNIGDYGNITVMEYTGNYDAISPDGTINALPRQEVSNEFFSTHKDEYDFIVIFTNFDFQMPASEALAFYSHIRNNSTGIGKELFDNSSFFGSSGKLQGCIDMGNIRNLHVTPLDPDFEQTLYILAHEYLHRWGAYIEFRDTDGSDSNALISLGEYSAHWSFLTDSDGSVLYGNDWQENGDSTFTSIGTIRYYSALDLYLMGFYDKTQVPPIMLIENPGIDAARMPEIGTTIEGTPKYITIDDIIASEGERTPGTSESQKNFKTAFIYITSPGTFTSENLYGLENIRQEWMTRFSVLTDGKGMMEVSPSRIEDLPTNPGIILPPVDTRIDPANIRDGVSWLMDNQETDGSWMDSLQTAQRDTAEALLALSRYLDAQVNYFFGLSWLHDTDSENMVFISKKIEVFKDAGENASALIEELVSAQNNDGGWGSNKNYMSNPADTSFVLKALAVSEYPEQNILSSAIDYILSKQNPDGSWGSSDGEGYIEVTTNVLAAFNKLRGSFLLDDQITSGLSWLVQQQNPNGGFGNSQSTIYDSAMVIMTLREFDVSPNIINTAINYILDLQSENGSWYGSPHQTAVAVHGIFKATIDPDLSIVPEDMTITPDSVESLPTDIEVRAEIWNRSLTDITDTTVVLYDSTTSGDIVVGEETVSITGQSSVLVTFSLTITDGDQHRFYISADPDNLIHESNETNNTVIKVLSPISNYDFEIISLTVSSASVDFFQDVTLSSGIRNNGTLDAFNVHIQYFIDDPATGALDIASTTMDIPAGTTINNDVTWRTSKAGDDMTVTVMADPFDSIPELSETNNTASILLSVIPSTEPNLTVSHEDMVITPVPALEGGSVNISALIKNEGFSSASDIRVDVYNGVPGQGGALIGTGTITFLPAGESETVAVDWTDIAGSGEKIVYVQVDPEGLITEITEDDNTDFAAIQVLSLPDLVISAGAITFDPPAPKEGDTVAIRAAIQNSGEQGASNVIVSAYEGSALIDSTTIASMPANSPATVSFTYNTAGNPGAHNITVRVDPDNAIPEQRETNNEATRSFGVQDADLWMTEQYISPNGDNIQDSTQFFFRMNTPQTVTIAIVNDEGETVRIFNGAQFENTTGGSITWDGLDENGVVVDDGRYDIQVLTGSNSIIMSLSVIVDNNRSPFSDALGTNFLVSSFLTSDFGISYKNWYSWSWFPDESGIFLRNLLRSYTSPLEDTTWLGLFKLAPNGLKITRLGRIEWVNDVIFSSNGYHWDQRGWVSPDSQKVAISATRMENSAYNPDIYTSELWVADGNGTNLTLLDSLTNSWILSASWSADSSKIHYSARYPSGNGYGYENYIIGVDGSGKEEDPNSGGTPSPDGEFYASKIYDSGTDRYILNITDNSGNTTPVYESSDTFKINQWINSDSLLITEPIPAGSSYLNNFILVNTTSGGSFQKLFQIETQQTYNIERVEISPDKQNIVVRHYEVDSNYLATYSITLCDLDGNTHTHEFKPEADLVQGSCCSPFMSSNIAWSPDGTRFAFFQGLAGEDNGECMIPCNEAYTNFVIIDTLSGEKTSLPINIEGKYQRVEIVSWFSDGFSILGYLDYGSYAWEESRIFELNLKTGKTIDVRKGVYLLPKLSPFENYIAYEGAEGINTLRSVLNLTAEVQVKHEGSALILTGIAQDLNFDGYSIEYADSEAPDTWHLITPPSDIPVVNDIFATWIPPNQGTYFVKLIVRDRAGNIAWDRKQVSWSRQSGIAGLYKTLEYISPNGDGVKDSVELHYSVLNPVHLDFSVYGEDRNLIRTFTRDHAVPGSDFITWDGTDESGSVVPDGKYTIRIFDYRFFVKVDSTPPVANLFLWPVSQKDFKYRSDDELIYQPGTIYTELHAYAVDNNLKHWIFEWGEGSNPQQWYEIEKGSEILASLDADGNPSPDPEDVVRVKSFMNSQIEELVGKRVKLTVEDFAGNVSSLTANDFLEEAYYFFRWGLEETWHLEEEEAGRLEYQPFDIVRQYIPFTSGITTMGLLETIREELSSVTIQYSEDKGDTWIDADILENPPSGYIEITWDTSPLDPSNLDCWIRLKLIDVLGNEYYTNDASTNPGLLLLEQFCGDMFGSNEYRNLDLLAVQWRSPANDNWTDYETYEPPDIPLGNFTFPLPQDYDNKTLIDLRLKGVKKTIQGPIEITNTFYSNTETYPSDTDCPKLNVDFWYEEAKSCDTVSPGIATMGAVICHIPSKNILQGTLTYYMEHTDGSREILAELHPVSFAFNIPQGPCGNFSPYYGTVDIDTKGRDEGLYTITAELQFVHSVFGQQRVEGTGELVVDRTLPSAEIIHPNRCPILIPGTEDRYGVSMEGSATDNHGVKRYEIYFNGNKETGFSSHQGSLGIWDITGMEKTEYPVLLRVSDIAGNKACFSADISLDAATKIVGLTAEPEIFSPDNDGNMEEVEVRYETGETVSVDIQVFSLIRNENGTYDLGSTVLRTIATGIQHTGGIGTAVWDGRDDSGTVVADGNYGFAVTVTDSCGNKHKEWVLITVGDTVSDDRPPEVILLTPNEGELFGAENSPIQINGTIVEENIDSYSLRYGPGDSPVQWTSLRTGNSLPADTALFQWQVGSSAGIPDGPYTISLYARDLGGLESEARIRITIDNTSPDVMITSPGDNGYIKGPADIVGTASDQHFESFTIETAAGSCSSASRWITMTTSSNAMQDGTLASWNILPPDGAYCIRLSSMDSAGNHSKVTHNILVDTKAPSPPVLSGIVENNTDAVLTWTLDQEPDLSGYNIYRNSSKINTELLVDTAYIDPAPGEGTLTYTVTVVDLAGWESIPSNEIDLFIDTTGPDTKISVPSDGATVSDIVDIKGTAYSADDFKEYRLYMGQGIEPSEWNIIRISPLPVSYGTLLKLDAMGYSQGIYSLRLEAEDVSGNINSDKVFITLDNTPPVAPMLLSAIPSGPDVTATWQTNMESDLAGYLLYRNDQLVNATGVVVENLKSYIISGTTHLDENLPDGTFAYYLVAMDEAGNISNPSNTIEVSLDTHAPKADIADPADSHIFEHQILVRADSEDKDIASIQIQFKSAGDSTWTDLDSELTTLPYIAYLDPAVAGLSFGDYHLRAIATDLGSQTDPAPAFIVVTYTDLTAPQTPEGLSALTDGNDITLTWTANTEPDLAGYNVYRMAGETRIMVNASPVTAAIYLDEGLANAGYTYEITAIDTFNNESSPSDTASAMVYAPVLVQPETPTGQADIQVNGSNASADTSIEAFVDNGSGPVSQGTTLADSDGNFTADINLLSGNNIITAIATDADGNISKTSNPVTVMYAAPPAPPQDLAAEAAGPDVVLTWTASSGPDLIGYNIYRNTTSGWMAINPELVTELIYTDGDLSSGTYIYRLTGVNSSGIESIPSNEASVGVSAAPSRPELFLPLLTQGCLDTRQSSTDIFGIADPGNMVELFKQGITFDTTTASDVRVEEDAQIQHWSDKTALSPDGGTLAYIYNQFLWLMDVSTGDTAQTAQMAESFETGPQWSYDGNKIATMTYDSTWTYMTISIYDLETGQSTPLSDNQGIDEKYPTWLADGRLAFVIQENDQSAIWAKDLTDGTSTELSDIGSYIDFTPSPDGGKIAYYMWPNLYVVDLSDNTTVEIETGTSWFILRPSWSPDSTRLVYASSVSNILDLHVFDTITRDQTQITNSTQQEGHPVWYPGGEKLVFQRLDDNGTRSVWIVPAAPPGDADLIYEGINNGINYLGITESGAFAYVEQNAVKIIHPAGLFLFENVPLDPDENLFHAVAADVFGNESDPSDTSCIRYDAAWAPDLEVTIGDIFIYPPYPLEDEEVSFTLLVRNKGPVEAEDVLVDCYMWNAADNLELLASETIPNMLPGSEEFIFVQWSAAGKTGTNTFTVDIDPDDMIFEADESNNQASQDFPVAPEGMIILKTAVDAEKYAPDQYVDINVSLSNSGSESSGIVKVRIEDENGNEVMLLDTINAALPYASHENYDYMWNTGTTYAGAYRLRAVLYDGQDEISGHMSPFIILPDTDISSSAATDKAGYSAEEDVVVSVNITSNSRNHVIPELDVQLSILDSNDTELYMEDRQIQNLLPGTMTSLDTTWNTTLNPPGDYQAKVDVFVDGQVLSTSTAAFTINSTTTITGSLTVTPQVVMLGNTWQTDYTVHNSGNTDLSGLVIKVEVIDPETMDVILSDENTIDLAMNTSAQGQSVFSSQGLDLKSYFVKLRHEYQQAQKSISNVSVKIIDSTPPVVSIVSPVTDTETGASIVIAALASDNASGVDTVEYRIDNDQWNLLPLSDVSAGRYATTWTTDASNTGSHLIEFRATDRSGNVSPPVSTPIIVELVLTAEDDAYSVNEDNALVESSPGLLANDEGFGATLTATLISSVSNGALTLNPDGSFTYTPGLNFNGTDIFSYQSAVNAVSSNTAWVTITINPINDAPEAMDDSASTEEDTAVTIDVLSNDTDADSAIDPATTTITTGPGSGRVSVDPATGVITYTPNAGFTGTDTFTYTVNDTQGAASNPATVEVIVNQGIEIQIPDLTEMPRAEAEALVIAAGLVPSISALECSDTVLYGSVVRQNPAAETMVDPGTTVELVISTGQCSAAPVAEDDAFTVNEDQVLNVDAPGVLVNDTDANTGDVITAVLVSGPANGTLDLFNDGSFMYTPDENFNGNDSFTYMASDGTLESSTATVSITINPINDAPEATAGPDQADVSLGDILLSGSASDVDGDFPLNIFWDVESEPFTGAGMLAGEDTLNSVLAITGYGTYEVELEVCDHELCDTDTIVIATEANLPPTANAGADRTADLNEEICLNGSGTDPNEDGITLSWTITAPNGSSVTLDDPFLQQPCFTVNQIGEYTADLVVSDGELNSEVDTIIITAGGNTRPISNAGDDQEVESGNAVCLDGSNSSDPDPGDVITYSWTMISWPLGTDIPAFDNPVDQKPCFTPYAAGEYVVQLIVNDGELDSEPDIAVITVTRDVQTIFDLAARAKSGKVQPTWSPVPGAQCYNVYRSTTSGEAYDLIAQCHMTDYCTYLDLNVVNGTTYFYVVTSVVNEIESLYSNEASATPQARRRR